MAVDRPRTRDGSRSSIQEGALDQLIAQTLCTCLTGGDVVTVTIRLTDDEAERLSVLAQQTGRSTSFHVRTAIQTYLEDSEDAYAAREASKEFEADGRRSLAIGELAAELGLDENVVRDYPST